MEVNLTWPKGISLKKKQGLRRNILNLSHRDNIKHTDSFFLSTLKSEFVMTCC